MVSFTLILALLAVPASVWSSATTTTTAATTTATATIAVEGDTLAIKHAKTLVQGDFAVGGVLAVGDHTDAARTLSQVVADQDASAASTMQTIAAVREEMKAMRTEIGDAAATEAAKWLASSVLKDEKIAALETNMQDLKDSFDAHLVTQASNVAKQEAKWTAESAEKDATIATLQAEVDAATAVANERHSATAASLKEKVAIEDDVKYKKDTKLAIYNAKHQIFTESNGGRSESGTAYINLLKADEAWTTLLRVYFWGAHSSVLVKGSLGGANWGCHSGVVADFTVGISNGPGYMQDTPKWLNNRFGSATESADSDKIEFRMRAIAANVVDIDIRLYGGGNGIACNGEAPHQIFKYSLVGRYKDADPEAQYKKLE